MKTFIKLLRTPTDEDKLGPQQKACMNAVVKAVDGKVGAQAERTKVIEGLTSGGELTTRQEPARILSFYQPQFKDKGLIEIVKVADEKPAAAPKAEKTGSTTPAAAATPAKAPAPAAKPVGATA